MSRIEVYRDIEETLGLVPSFFKTLPDETIELEWETFKAVQLTPGKIPNKYRELIGLGMAAATRCRYCVLFHTEAAKLFGATDDEILEAMRFVKSSAGWSAYVNGISLDYEQFKDELKKIVNYVSNKMERLEATKASV